MIANEIRFGYRRNAEPTASSFVNEDSEESSTPIANSIRETPIDGRNMAFANKFVTPGAVVDDTVSSSRSQSRNRVAFKESKQSAGTDSAVQDLDAEGQSCHDSSSQTMQCDIDQELNKKFREAFLIFDRDNDGRITSAEMARAMQSLGYVPSEQEIADIFDKADINRNGTIEFDEFVQVMSSQIANQSECSSRSSVEQELQIMFEVFDLNKDGRITAQELNYAMRTLGENLSKKELEDMMKTADSNGDGIIDFEEFQNLFRLYDQSFNGSNTNKMIVTSR